MAELDLNARKTRPEVWIPVIVAAITVIGSVVGASINMQQADLRARLELLPTINVLETRIAEPTPAPIKEEMIVTQVFLVTPTSIPTSTPSPYLIDQMNIVSNWKPSVCNDECGQKNGNASSSVFVNLVPGQTNEAIEILYDVENAGWVLITKNVDPQTLSGTTGLSFSYKGRGASNTIELKLLLRYPGDSRDTTFGASWNGKTDTDDNWSHIEALYNKDFTCWFPEDLCRKHSDILELTAVKRIDLAISNKPGDTVGLGKVAFDDLVGIAP